MSRWHMAKLSIGLAYRKGSAPQNLTIYWIGTHFTASWKSTLNRDISVSVFCQHKSGVASAVGQHAYQANPSPPLPTPLPADTLRDNLMVMYLRLGELPRGNTPPPWEDCPLNPLMPVFPWHPSMHCLPAKRLGLFDLTFNIIHILLNYFKCYLILCK